MHAEEKLRKHTKLHKVKILGIGAAALTFHPLASVNAEGIQAPPPPIRIDAPAESVPTLQTENPITAGSRTLSSSPARDIQPMAFGSGQTTWSENAENGVGQVINGTTGYDLIQSADAAQGTRAFHLANPNFQDNWFELNVNIDVGPDTKLFFFSKLQWATTSQIARAQISTNGGTSWVNLFSQPGTDGSGEGAFSLKEIALGAYKGQQARIRFFYEHTGGSAYIDVTSNVGWLIDDIHINTSFPKILWSTGQPSPHETLYVELINRARASASTEAQRLSSTTNPELISTYALFKILPANIVSQFAWNVSGGCMEQSAQPLAIRNELTQAARLHSQDMFNNQFQGHTSSGTPVAPILAGDNMSQRTGRLGYTGWFSLAENVYAYSKNVEYGHAGFEVDWGTTTNSGNPCYNAAFNGQGMQNPAGHRLTIHNGDLNEIGVGVVNGQNGSVGPQVVTQDFGGRSGVAYICGVVYDDLNSDAFYSVTNATSHEGRGGIRVDVAGSPHYTITADSGAYAIPVTANGSYQVTFSGTNIQTYSTTVAISGLRSVKLDHDPLPASGSLTYAGFSLLHSLTGGPNDDDDGDGVPNRVEYVVAGMNPKKQDSSLLSTQNRLPNGSLQITIQKRTGVEMGPVPLLSADLVTWVAPGIIPGTSIGSDSPEQITIMGANTLPKLFFKLGAQ